MIRTVALIGAKGGSGSSTLVYELSRALQREKGIAVVDADLSGRRSLAILFDAVRAFDSARQKQELPVISLGNITGVEIAENLDAAFALRAEIVERMAVALNGCSTVLVDAPHPFAGAVRPFIARASRFLIVMEPNLLGMTGARSLINECARFGIAASRLGVITNARDGKCEATTAEIEKLLAIPVFADIPHRSDRNYLRVVDQCAYRLLSIQPEELQELRSPRTPIGDRRLEQRGANVSEEMDPFGTRPSTPAAALPAHEALKAKIHEALSKQMDPSMANVGKSDAHKLAELRAKINEIAQAVLAEQQEFISPEEIVALREEVVDEALGLGPLESLLKEDDITEIMVNGPNLVYCERNGKIELTSKRFTDARQLRVIVERIIAPLGRRIDEAQPMVDARLPDGSRVNAIIEPLAIDGATVTIRRFGKRRLDTGDLLRLGAVNEQVLDFLRACVEARLNVVVSGGTGSGKTTFLNILSGFIPPTERIITIEDAAELLLRQTHVVRLESRPLNIEGRGEIRIRDLVRNALRMRPDRIIVGECRGGEALDMLQAMNTGHDGSLTTVHANSTRDALARIETMVLMAGFDLPVRAIREQVASAVNIVIQTARMRDGSRKVTNIAEVVGMEGDIVTTQEILAYKQRGVENNAVVGDFQYSGVQPNCLKRFEEVGIHFDSRTLSELPLASSLW